MTDCHDHDNIHGNVSFVFVQHGNSCVLDWSGR